MLDLTPIERLHISSLMALTLRVPNHPTTFRQRTRAAFCELMSWPDAEEVADALRVAARLERNLTEIEVKRTNPEQLADAADVSVEVAVMALKLMGRTGDSPHEPHEISATIFQ